MMSWCWLVDFAGFGKYHKLSNQKHLNSKWPLYVYGLRIVEADGLFMLAIPRNFSEIFFFFFLKNSQTSYRVNR